MPQLHVALLDGFFGDEVVVRIHGQEVFREPSVRTRMQISRAAEFEVDVPDGTAPVEIELPGRAARAEIAVPVADTPYLGISLTRAGQLVHVLQPEPFHYA